MVSLKYLQFFINKILLKCSNITDNDINTFKNIFFENQNNLSVWIWLAHTIEEYIINKDQVDIKKFISIFNEVKIEDLIFDFKEKYPFLVYNGQIVEFTNKNIRINNIVDVNELLKFGFWNSTQKAEIILAMNGHKVSRTSISTSNLLELSKKIKCHFIISREIHTPNEDQNIRKYSNLISKSTQLSPTDSLTDKQGEVFIYFSKYLQDAYFTAVLDSHNLAGTLLGIPECCINSFKTNWPIAIKLYEGDLAFMNYIDDFKNNEQKKIKHSWQTNAHSMYLGGGLIWHFPCSKDCQNTIDIINERVKLLQEYDCGLYNELYTNQIKSFFLDRSRKVSYKRITEDNLFISFHTF